MAMLAAFAYMIMALVRIPVVLFLKYEPKDVIITIGGFLLGPMASFIVSLVVSLISSLPEKAFDTVETEHSANLAIIFRFISGCHLAFLLLNTFYHIFIRFARVLEIFTTLTKKFRKGLS